MLIDNASIQKMAIHLVGNKSQDEPLIFSENAPVLDDNLNEILSQFFLEKFIKIPERFHFNHPSSLQFNEIYNFSKEIIYNKGDFQTISQKIAQHLYDCSEHPMIKGGELYVCYFNQIGIDEQYYNAVGIFKTENKNGFLEVGDEKANFQPTYKEGIDINKLDKACLILDNDEENGYEVLIIDTQKKGSETALYWKDDFLGVMPVENNYYQTNELITATKDFIKTQLDEEFIVSNTDKIDLLNKSVQYFKNAEEFVLEEFNDSVFQNEEIKQSFNEFTGNEFAENNFEINDQAVKKNNKFFKSVIKLDKNFHIYVHGNKEMIENGTDEQGRRYYKLYYENES